MIALKTLIHKTSFGPKMLQLKMCMRNNQKKSAPEKFSPVSSEITERFSLLLAGDEIAICEELKEQIMGALHFDHPTSTKLLAQRNTFRWSGIRSVIKKKCSRCTASMTSGTNLKYQLRSRGKIKLPVLVEPGEQIQSDFSRELHKKQITGELYTYILSELIDIAIGP